MVRLSVARLLFLVAFLVLAAGTSAPRAALDLYSEQGIEVDVTAESAVAARQLAIEQAQRSGLERLLRRLAAVEAASRLPDVGSLDIQRFVRGYAVEEEKRSATRYIARITVHYREDAVRALLESAGVAAVLEPSRPLLLLPVLADAEDARLAGEFDPWWRAWGAELGRNTITALVLPLGDLADIAAMRRYLEGSDPQAALAIARRYDLDAAAVATARILERDAEESAVRLELEVRTFGDWPAVEQVSSLGRRPGEEEDDFWRRAAVIAKAWLDAAWKRDNLVRTDVRGRKRLLVPLADLAGWVQIRRRLESVPEIRSVGIDRLTRELAELTVEFVGGDARLERRLVERGLQPVAENGTWRLRPVAAGEGR